ncbi:hypothetical protein MnTg02_00394 [bacterium MnTg02]|nr:hypothetical protein MnTg02_00394 [bacterium MnTg02]
MAANETDAGEEIIAMVLEFNSKTIGKRDCVASANWRSSPRGA